MFDRLFEKFPFLSRWNPARFTREKFAKLLIKKLEAADSVSSVEYDAEQFRLIVDGQQFVNLANFYDEHVRLDKEGRDAHVGNILQGIFQSGFELPKDFEDARHDLLPKVWPRSAFDRLDLQASVDGREPSGFASVPLGPHLYLGLVYDLPRSVRTIRSDELKEWGVSLYEALEMACDNLRSRPMTVGKIGPQDEDDEGEADTSDGPDDSGTLPFTPPQEYTGEDNDDENALEHRESIAPDGRVYLFITGDSYDATRIVLVSDLHQMELAGAPVVMAPNRDALLVAGRDDPEGLATMASLASQMYEGEPRPLVPIPLTFTEDGEWVELTLDRDHPARELFHTLELKYLAEEYNEQKPLLEQLYAKQYLNAADSETAQEPPFVASLLVAESDGKYESHAVWAEDLDTLLPKADVVAFMKQSENAIPIQVPWADVMAVLDDLLEPVPEHYPPRWQVKEFPSDLALKILTEEES